MVRINGGSGDSREQGILVGTTPGSMIAGLMTGDGASDTARAGNTDSLGGTDNALIRFQLRRLITNLTERTTEQQANTPEENRPGSVHEYQAAGYCETDHVISLKWAGSNTAHVHCICTNSSVVNLI